MSTRGTWKNRSGTIATGGTAQPVCAANSTRDAFIFQNLHASSDMWLDIGATAVADTPSLKVAAGQTLILDSVVPVDAVSVICATTGAKYTCKEQG